MFVFLFFFVVCLVDAKNLVEFFSILSPWNAEVDFLICADLYGQILMRKHRRIGRKYLHPFVFVIFETKNSENIEKYLNIQVFD